MYCISNLLTICLPFQVLVPHLELSSVSSLRIKKTVSYEAPKKIFFFAWERFTTKKQQNNTLIWFPASLQLQAEARRERQYTSQRLGPIAAAQHIADNTQANTNSLQLFDLQSCDLSLCTLGGKRINTERKQ